MANNIQSMILLRSVLGKWRMRMPQFVLSTVKGVKQATHSQLPNPFKNKSYQQINRIMSLSISRKNEIIFCSLVLSAALERMEIEFSKKQQLSTTQKNSKQELMNKVLEKMFAKLEELTPEDSCLIVKMILTAYENRYFKLTNRNKDIFQNDLQNQLAIQVEEDKTGVHKDTFKDILYTMLKSKKRIGLLKQIIDYLIIHDLRTNEEMLRFFNQFSSHNRTGYYNQSIEPVLAKFLAMNAKNLHKASEWVHPIVLEIILIYTDKLRIQTNPYFKQFLVGLEHQFKKGKISIENQVLFFRQLLSWAQWTSPYFLKVEEIIQGVNLIYALMKDLGQRIENNEQEESFNGFIHLVVMMDKFREFAKFAHGVIGKSQNQLMKQFYSLIQLIFNRKFIPKFDKLGPEQMVQIINCRIQLSQSLSKTLVERLIKFLDQHESENYLITRLRIYEFVAKLIIEKKVSIDLSSLNSIIRKIESKSHKLKDYEIIRIRNVLQLLKIESTIIENLFKELLAKKQSVIIQNMARTTLKDYSISQIQRYSQMLVDKSENDKKNYGDRRSWLDSVTQSSIRNILWSSFKKVKAEGPEQNTDPIFIFWVDKNRSYFSEITKDYRNCYLILSNAVKEFNLGAKGIESSVNYEILFQILKSWSRQNPNPKPEEYSHLISDNLRHFAQSDNISTLFENQFRHSFFIKVLWAFHILKNTPMMKQSYIKRFRQISQIMLLVKSLKVDLYRQKSNLKMELIQNYLNSLQTHHNVRLKLFNNTVQPWFWANYHNIVRPKQEFIGSANSQKIEKYILNRLGPIYLADYLVGNPQEDRRYEIGQLIKGNVLMWKIYEGQLASDTQIDAQTLLSSIIFTKLLGFLFERHPSQCEVYLTKLMNVRYPIIYEKLVEIANQVQRLRKYLPLSALRKLKQEIKEIILGIDPHTNPSIIPLYVKFNISSPSAAACIESYIVSQLKTGNFYIAQLLYINGYDNTGPVQYLINITDKNRVLQFLDIFPYERILLLEGFLGLSLTQSGERALKQCVQIFVGQQDFKNLLVGSYSQNRQIVLDCYMLLQIAHSRLSSTKSMEGILGPLIAGLRNQIPQIDTKLLERLHKNTCSAIPQPILDTLAVSPSTTLPMWDNQIVIVDRGQPGYTKLLVEYLQTYYHAKDVLVVHIDEIDLKLVQQGPK